MYEGACVHHRLLTVTHPTTVSFTSCLFVMLQLRTSLTVRLLIVHRSVILVIEV